MTIDTLDTLVPQQVRTADRGCWTLPEDFALLVAGPAITGSMPVLPSQRRPVLESVPTTSITPARVADRGVWVVPPQRSVVAVAGAAASIAAPVIDNVTSSDPVEQLATVLPGPPVVPVEPAATAGRLLPIRLPAIKLPSVPLLPNRSGSIGWRRPTAASALAVLVTLSSGAPTFGGDDTKSITVTIDGQNRTITTLAGSVGGALESVGIPVRGTDVVAPSLDGAITDGSRINLRRGKPLTLRIDGTERQVWTTADTLSGALTELGIDPARYELSASRNRTLSLDGLSVVGTSLRPVTLTVGTAPAKKLSTPARTVAEVLAAQGIRLAKTDKVSPAPDTVIAGGEQIQVTRVQIETESLTEKIPQPKPVSVQDANLGKGETKVEKGRAGVRKITVQRTTVNGTTSEKQIANSIVRRATPDRTAVGTQETGAKESWSVPWDDMAFCESTSRWDVNTGNGTYGGLQFMTPTWLAYGGGEFAPRADLATKEQQIIVAERLYAVEGLAPWHCARLLGWGFGKYQG